MIVRNRKLGLLIAVVFGLAAALSSAFYMVRLTQTVNPSERVVVARRDIASRTVVTEDMLTVREVPKGAKHPDAVSSLSEIVGKTTKQKIDAQEQVLASKFFGARQETGLAYIVPPGMRAVAVGVDERSSAGGNIAAGDRVDVMGICTMASRERGSDANAAGVSISKSMFTLQNIEVLAVAQKIAGTDSPSPIAVLRSGVQGGGTASLAAPRPAPEEAKARTVTMALSLKQAQTVVLVEENPSCDIRLALRNVGDQETEQVPEVQFNPALPLPGPVE